MSEPVLALDDLDVARLPTPTGYRYTLAGNWMHVDLRPDRLTTSVRRIVERRVARFPELSPHRMKLIKLLRMQAHEARARGVERLAMFSEPVRDLPVTASFNLITAPGIPGAGSLTNEPDLVADSLAAHVPDGHDPAGREVSVERLIQQVAVRVRARTVLRDEPSGREVHGDGVQYYVPRPGSTDLVVLSYHTPCLPAAEPLIAMFDLMALSFYFTWK